MQFDSKKFESLSGIEASQYAMALMAQGSVGDDILAYLAKTISQMDNPHLEVAVYLLGKSDNPIAWHMLADYLDHPNFSIRFMATKLAKDFTAVDEVVMDKVVKTLKANAGDGLADELRVLLKRGASLPAKEIANDYITNEGMSLE